jgi:tryptophan synthase alpha chain
MNKISQTFQVLRARGERAFVPFLVVGDPTPDAFLEVIKAVEPSADVLELGIPFSDPIADGPAIQAGNQRAMTAGTTLLTAYDLIAQVRSITPKPIVVLTYANVVGVADRAGRLRRLAAAGVDGVIIADVPLEESGDFRATANAAGIALVMLAAPTTPPDRLRVLAGTTQGFLYLVALRGVTGERGEVAPETVRFLDAVSDALGPAREAPVCVGFGIGTAAHARAVLAHDIDGVIVGSALVSEVGQMLTDPERTLGRLRSLAAAIKAETRPPQQPQPGGN